MAAHCENILGRSIAMLGAAEFSATRKFIRHGGKMAKDAGKDAKK